MHSIYKRRINQILLGNRPVYNNIKNKKNINWLDIVKYLNLNNVINNNKYINFGLYVYQHIYSNLGIQTYKLENISHRLYGINIDLHAIQDNGNLVFINIVNNLDNIKLKDEQYLKVQLQLECANLKTCNIFNCVIEDNIYNYKKNNIIGNNLYTHDLNKTYFSDDYVLNKYSITSIEKDNLYVRDLLNKINNINKNDKTDDIQTSKKNTQTSKQTISRKRKREDLSNNEETIIDWSEWVSASKVRNYLIKDPLLDWLNYRKYNLKNINTNTNNSIKSKNNISYDSFTSYILKKGLEFEDIIMNVIRKNFIDQVVQIGESYDARKISKYHETIEAMKKGIPIIYQGILHNYENKTYGAPDLIVRSDYINKLVKDNVLSKEEEQIPAPKLGLNNYHYRIVDIKCCTLNLTADGKQLLNSGSINAYKGQLYIYTKALGQVTGYIPDCAYILGKKWNYTSYKKKYEGYDSFDKLGVINYEKFDKKYKKLTNDAINWIKKLRREGHIWKIFDKNNNNKPTIKELYPNMSNYHDSPWRSYKEDISTELNEITSLWNCGVNNRNNAHSQNIYGWTDDQCNSTVLNIRGKKTAPILDEILKINKSKKRKITNVIKNNDSLWSKKSELEFYVDFETISDVCTDFNIIKSENSNYTIKSTGSNMIFMIGVGYELEGEWKFITFLAKDNTLNEEKRMINRFYRYITNLKNEILGLNEPYPNMYHWGHAERTLFQSAKRRHPDNNWNNLVWFDMLQVFKKEPIVINGCLNFGLKNIAKAMYKHGFIKTIWRNNNSCSNGTNAMIFAYNEYNKYRKNNENIKNSSIITDIAEYNEIDCKVIWEIVNYLRCNCYFIS